MLNFGHRHGAHQHSLRAFAQYEQFRTGYEFDCSAIRIADELHIDLKILLQCEDIAECMDLHGVDIILEDALCAF